tara:strand:+ start:1285 stop:1578 length:294 start_codon:yes stop_codon:yes gene_type:complete
MFQLLFEGIRNIHYNTRILESVSWDQEEADRIIEKFSKAMSSLESGEYDTKMSVRDNIHASLSEDIKGESLDVILDIVEDMLENSDIKALSSRDYEN